MLKKLLNSPERITYGRLCEVTARHAADVYTKVRLADVLAIENSGLPEALYAFALQAHYDFVITGKDHVPLFAVEFDGPQHEDSPQIERDLKKNELSRRFHLPLLRVHAADLCRTELRLDRLTELIEQWFSDHPELVSGQNKSQHQVACPLCGDKMVQKRGKYGPFLSCVRYPVCTGARDLPVSLFRAWGKVLIAGSVVAVIVVAMAVLLLVFQYGFLGDGDGGPANGKITLRERQVFASEIQQSDYPVCPKCGKRMALRENSRTGEPFFGCSDFPNCRGTRDVQYPK
ncbi:MAG: topoisomerase DNA-binding C4 zinc finger domain-containing protein [Pirellulaceae bacterium]